MNFKLFKEFKGNATPGEIFNYLKIDLAQALRELSNGLKYITFLENFECFEEVLTIAPSTEVIIRNRLPNTPTKFIITMRNDGGIYVCKGDTQWTQSQLTLKNVSATLTASVTVLFLK